MSTKHVSFDKDNMLCEFYKENPPKTLSSLPFNKHKELYGNLQELVASPRKDNLYLNVYYPKEDKYKSVESFCNEYEIYLIRKEVNKDEAKERADALYNSMLSNDKLIDSFTYEDISKIDPKIDTYGMNIIKKYYIKRIIINISDHISCDNKNDSRFFYILKDVKIQNHHHKQEYMNYMKSKILDINSILVEKLYYRLNQMIQDNADVDLLSYQNTLIEKCHKEDGPIILVNGELSQIRFIENVNIFNFDDFINWFKNVSDYDDKINDSINDKIDYDDTITEDEYDELDEIENFEN